MSKSLMISVHAKHLVNILNGNFDTPLSLSDFNIKRPPQSWRYIKKLEGVKYA